MLRPGLHELADPLHQRRGVGIGGPHRPCLAEGFGVGRAGDPADPTVRAGERGAEEARATSDPRHRLGDLGTGGHPVAQLPEPAGGPDDRDVRHRRRVGCAGDDLRGARPR